jgi:hypothetical protein
MRDHLGNAGFSDIAVFTGTAPALDGRGLRGVAPDTARIIVAGLKKVVLRTGMEALYFTGAHRLLRPLLGGVGAILTLHHVRPPRADAFPAEPAARSVARFLDDVLAAAARARRHRHARRDAPAARGAISVGASSASRSTMAIGEICATRCRS